MDLLRAAQQLHHFVTVDRLNSFDFINYSRQMCDNSINCMCIEMWANEHKHCGNTARQSFRGATFILSLYAHSSVFFPPRTRFASSFFPTSSFFAHRIFFNIHGNLFA